MRQDSEQFIPHGSFLEPWAFVAQGVTGAAIERPLEGVESNEHSSAEGRGHVSEASLALEPWAAVGRLKPGVLGGGTT